MAFLIPKPHIKSVEFSGGNVATVRVRCIVTGKENVVTTTETGYTAWLNGTYAQTAFRDLSVDDRELLISGTSKEGWAMLYGDEEGLTDEE